MRALSGNIARGAAVDAAAADAAVAAAAADLLLLLLLLLLLSAGEWSHTRPTPLAESATVMGGSNQSSIRKSYDAPA